MTTVSVGSFDTLEDCEIARGRLAAFRIESECRGALDPFPGSQGYDLLVAKDQSRTALKILKQTVLQTDESAHQTDPKFGMLQSASTANYSNVHIFWYTPFLVLLPGFIPLPLFDSLHVLHIRYWGPDDFSIFYCYQILWIIAATLFLRRAGFTAKVLGLSWSPIQLLHTLMILGLVLALFLVASAVYSIFGDLPPLHSNSNAAIPQSATRGVIIVITATLSRFIAVVTVVHCAKRLRWPFIFALLYLLILLTHGAVGSFDVPYPTTDILDAFATFTAIFIYYYFFNTGTALALAVFFPPAVEFALRYAR